MPDNKIITLENLTEFKAKCDETYSGTKLYKHEFKLFNSSYVEVPITIIATTSSPITSYTGGPAKLDIEPNKVALIISPNGLVSITYSNIGTSGIHFDNIYRIDPSNGSYESFTIQSGSITDTVTEL